MTVHPRPTPGGRRRARLAASALLVVVLAVLAGLYLLLSKAPDYAAPYAFLMLAIFGGSVWLLGRRKQRFRRWRALWTDAWRAEQSRQRWAVANPQLPEVRRRSRLFGLALTVGGLVLVGALGVAVWLGDLRIYGFIFTLPLALVGIGVWMLVSARHPGSTRGGDED